MSRKLPILALLLLLTTTTLFAQDQMRGKAEEVLAKYEQLGSLTETNRYISDEYVEQFQELFANDNAMVYNDLSKPAYADAEVRIEDYLITASAWFPEGITLFVKDADYGDVITTGSGYVMRVDVTKTMEGFTSDGNYLSAYDNKLSFVIGCDDSYSDCKIYTIKTYDSSINPEDYFSEMVADVAPVEDFGGGKKKKDKKKKKGTDIKVPAKPKVPDVPDLGSGKKKKDKKDKKKKGDDFSVDIPDLPDVGGKKKKDKKKKGDDFSVDIPDLEKEKKSKKKKADEVIADIPDIGGGDKKDKKAKKEETNEWDLDIPMPSDKKKKKEKETDYSLPDPSKKKEKDKKPKKEKKPKGLELDDPIETKDKDKEQKKKQSDWAQVIGDTKGKGSFVGFYVGPYLSTLSPKFDGDLFASGVEETNRRTTSPLSFFGKLDYYYFFNKRLGVGLSLHYGQYRSRLNIDEITHRFNYVDDDGDDALRSLDHTKHQGSFNTDNIGLGLHIDYKRPLREDSNLGFYISGGARADFFSLTTTDNLAISGNYNAINTYDSSTLGGSSGNAVLINGEEELLTYDLTGFTNSGGQPLNAAETEYLENYNLYNGDFVAKETLDQNPLVLIGTISGGLAYAASESFHIRLGLNYTMGFNPVFAFNGSGGSDADEVSSADFVEITQTGAGEVTYNTAVDVPQEIASGINLRGLGIEVGIIFELGE